MEELNYLGMGRFKSEREKKQMTISPGDTLEGG
jgi:hypothetical protein